MTDGQIISYRLWSAMSSYFERIRAGPMVGATDVNFAPISPVRLLNKAPGLQKYRHLCFQQQGSNYEASKLLRVEDSTVQILCSGQLANEVRLSLALEFKVMGITSAHPRGLVKLLNPNRYCQKGRGAVVLNILQKYVDGISRDRSPLLRPWLRLVVLLASKPF